MSNQLVFMLPVIKKQVITVQIPLIEEEKLIPLTQCSLLVEHNFISSCRNSKMFDAVALIFVVEPKHLFLVSVSRL